MDANLNLNSIGGNEMDEKKLYQSLLGGILHVNLATRPDVSYATNALARVSKRATTGHLKMLKKVLKYLETTKDLGLMYEPTQDDELDLSMEVDASFASTEERKSVHGFLVKIGNTPVAYRTKKQGLVTTSTTEAEFVGISESSKTLLYVKTMLEFMKEKLKKPMRVENDNKGALLISKQESSVGRTKHLEIKMFHVQDMVDKKLIELRYKNTKILNADLMTKALNGGQFESLRKNILRNLEEEESVEDHGSDQRLSRKESDN